MRILFLFLTAFPISTHCWGETVSYCQRQNYSDEISLTYETIFEDAELKAKQYRISISAPAQLNDSHLAGLSFQSNTGAILVPMEYKLTGEEIESYFVIDADFINYTYVVAYYGLQENGCPIQISSRVVGNGE